jgi:hypothetical protein
METEGRNDEEVREFRLEGVGLMLVGGLLIILLVASFYLGMWYERQTGARVPVGLEAGHSGDPLANVAQSEPSADVDEKTDFFDDLEGGQKELEPGRELESSREPVPEASAIESSAPSGPFWVQVVAGRDRASIENVIAELKAKGYSARLFTEREGAGSLYKVRVGGYAERSEADTIAQDLRSAGYSGAWVATVQ